MIPVRTSLERPSQRGVSREPWPLRNLSRYQSPGLYRFEQFPRAVLASFGNDLYGTTALSTARVLALARAFHKESHRPYALSCMP
jgi:hypothetical protein